MKKKLYIDATLLKDVFNAVTKNEGYIINYFLVPLRVVIFILMLIPVIIISINVKEVQ